MDPAELCPGGSEFLPGNCFILYERAMSDTPSLSISFAGCGASFSHWGQCNYRNKRKVFFFWPKAIELGSSLQGDGISSWDLNPTLLDFSVNYTHHSHGLDAGNRWLEFHNRLASLGCNFQRQWVGYGIGNKSSVFKTTSLPSMSWLQ